MYGPLLPTTDTPKYIPPPCRIRASPTYPDCRYATGPEPITLVKQAQSSTISEVDESPPDPTVESPYVPTSPTLFNSTRTPTISPPITALTALNTPLNSKSALSPPPTQCKHLCLSQLPHSPALSTTSTLSTNNLTHFLSPLYLNTMDSDNSPYDDQQIAASTSTTVVSEDRITVVRKRFIHIKRDARRRFQS